MNCLPISLSFHLVFLLPLCHSYPAICPGPSIEYDGTRIQHYKQHVTEYTFQVTSIFNTVFCTNKSEISETLEKVSVSTTFAQSRLVSVSTSFKILGLKESRSLQPSKLLVSRSLGLDIFCFLSVAVSESIWFMDY